MWGTIHRHIIFTEDNNTYPVTKEDGIDFMDLIPKKRYTDQRKDSGNDSNMTNGNGKNGKVTNGNGKSGNNGDNGNGNGNGGNGNGGKGNGVSGKNNNNKDNNKKKKKKGDESLTLECYFTYEGSLTTPPCTQTIPWIVVKDYILASTGQVCNTH